MIQYRKINKVSDEGFYFNLVLEYVAYFFKNIMRAQVRKDGPNTLIKWSRDWEYPWVLIKSEIKPGDKALDCGAGYSPVPFLWSKFGAEVHAIDRDIIIASKLAYFFRCIPIFFNDLKSYLYKKNKTPKSSNEEQNTKKKSRVFTFFNYFFILFRRIWRADFWGPISPKILNKYNINYVIGDFTNMPFDDNSFDIVSCVSVIEHMPRDTQLVGIKEMARVVKPGGKLIITYDNYVDLTESFIHNSSMTLSDSVYFKTPDDLYENNFPDVIGICLTKGEN